MVVMQVLTILISDRGSEVSREIPGNTVAVCHERKWFTDSSHVHTFKKVAFRQWAVRDAFGEKIFPGTDRSISRMETFLLLFPQRNSLP